MQIPNASALLRPSSIDHKLGIGTFCTCEKRNKFGICGSTLRHSPYNAFFTNLLQFIHTQLVCFTAEGYSNFVFGFLGVAQLATSI
jgi:hypothetical protein